MARSATSILRVATFGRQRINPIRRTMPNRITWFVVLFFFPLVIGGCGKASEEKLSRSVETAVTITCFPATIEPNQPTLVRVSATQDGQPAAGETILLKIGAVVHGPFHDKDPAEWTGRLAESALTLNQDGEAETSFVATARADQIAITAMNVERDLASCLVEVLTPKPGDSRKPPYLSLSCEPLGETSGRKRTVKAAVMGKEGKPVPHSKFGLTVVRGRQTERQDTRTSTLTSDSPAGFIVNKGKMVGVLSRSESGGLTLDEQTVEAGPGGKFEVRLQLGPLLKEVRAKAGQTEAACVWY